MTTDQPTPLEALQELIDSWGPTPAAAHDRHLYVVAANDAARAVLSIETGINLARVAFSRLEVDPDSAEWQSIRDDVTSILRGTLDSHEEDAGFRDVVGELASTSPDFASGWANTSAPPCRGVHHVEHSVHGSMALAWQQLVMPDDDEHIIVTWRGADSSTREAIRALLHD